MHLNQEERDALQLAANTAAQNASDADDWGTDGECAIVSVGTLTDNTRELIKLLVQFGLIKQPKVEK